MNFEGHRSHAVINFGGDFFFSPESYIGSDVLVHGCEMGCVNIPLHKVYLEFDLVTGPAILGVCS